ncbi:MAG TPA: PmeII family type II restriction endonuclease [Anaerolineaceae bacterium]|nr:PmeII family type II restriction endonuclease [Anaerolineaceae bacterium]
MTDFSLDIVKTYVHDHIGEFHNDRIKSLKSLKLKKILERKNPYLFKAKNMLTSEMIVRGFVDSHISSNEETIFGGWLEGLAIFINSRVFGGWKSGIPGIDLEFDNNGIRYIVNIKSGPNWGNSSQISKMIEDFSRAKKTLRTSNSGLITIAVNGCCYGKDNRPDKGQYFKYCGQQFWFFISGSEELYTDIIEPLGFDAKKKNDTYFELYANMINLFTIEFNNQFCKSNGEIDWKKLIQFNSKGISETSLTVKL